MVDTQLGEFGEQEARAQVERALRAAGVRFAGFSDKGLDTIVQFESSAPDRLPLHFAAQVRTGESFAQLRRGRWYVSGIDPVRFSQWRRASVPVLYIWVRPSVPAECYWTLVKRDSELKHFSIARRAVITPVTRFDLSLEMAREGDAKQLQAEILRAPLTGGLRDHAKSFYRRELLGCTVVNPVLGPVTFSWHAWRHMTRRGRSSHHIAMSLQLLRAAESAVANAQRFRALRRARHVVRGEWTCDTRLVAFRGLDLTFKSRANASITLVCQEQVWYPTNWQNDVRLHLKTRRVVQFHSIYEKVEAP